MNSSYTWYNLTRVTHFLDRRFLIEIIVKKKKTLNANFIVPHSLN